MSVYSRVIIMYSFMFKKGISFLNRVTISICYSVLKKGTLLHIVAILITVYLK